MKRYLITGASRGIGFALAENLLTKGNFVTSISRNKPELAFPKHVWCKHNFRDGGNIRYHKVYDNAYEGIILNAGFIGRNNDQWDFSDVETLDYYLDVNCSSQIELFEQLEKRECLCVTDCTVVVIGSFLEKGSADFPMYAMSKAMFHCWTQCKVLKWRRENKECWRINVVYPGRVSTSGNPKRDVNGVKFREPKEVAVDLIRILNEEKRTGQVIDLAIGENYD